MVGLWAGAWTRRNIRNISEYFLQYFRIFTQEWPRRLFSRSGTACQLNTRFQSNPENIYEYFNIFRNIYKALPTSYSEVATALVLQSLGVDHVNDWTNHISGVPDISRIMNLGGRSDVKLWANILILNRCRRKRKVESVPMTQSLWVSVFPRFQEENIWFWVLISVLLWVFL